MEQFVKVNGVKINYEIQNELQKETILFLHGNSHTLKSFKSVLAHPLLKNYKLIAMDLPGHGRSDRLDHYTLDTFSTIISSFVRQLGLDDVHLVGHSLGAHLGIGSLPKYNFKSLYSFGAPLLIPEYFGYAYLPHKNGDVLFSETVSMEKATELMSEFGYEGETLKEAVANYYNTDSRFRVDLLNECLNFKFKNEYEILKTSGIPAHFLICKNDKIVNNNYILDFGGNNPNFSFSSMLVGHNPVHEKMDDFVSDLHLFIKRCSL